MAEAVVEFVQEKLQDALTDAVHDALIGQAQNLCGVNDKAAALQLELQRIRSFLRDADSKRSTEQRVQNWVKEVRDVAYSIEDAIDTFQADVDRINYQEPGFRNAMKRFFKKPMLLPALYTLSSEIDGIQSRIKDISDAKSVVGVTSLADGSSQGSRHPIRRVILPDIDEMEVVGFEADRKNIIHRLLDEDNSRRSVVSIVGPGGIGKTTLAQAMYNNAEVKDSFPIRIWLSVSQEFSRFDLLKKMLEKLQPHNLRDHHELTEDNLIMEINASMKEKRYLVVMDDIWTEDLWYQLQLVFPDAKNGSRVLITSRFVNVAKAADPKPYTLQYLNEEESLQLLLKKAFPVNDPIEAFPENLSKLAKEFAKKCGGLPLQLVVLGGLLSRRSPNYATWHRIMETMDWITEGNNCLQVVATSYEHLPLHLKSCFMSFAIFPDDYEINAQSLISYWITEGFIQQEGKGSKYDKAQSYLEELAQRCMVEVTQRNPGTESVERCRVHALLRKLAIYEAKEKNFITVFCQQEDYQNRETTARHASFHLNSSSMEDKDVTEYTGPNVRTLMFFGKILPIHSQLKLLKVLIAYRTSITFGKHSWLEELISLRHLEFRECTLENDTLPETIDRLHHLEFLDLTDTHIADLPKSIKCNEASKVTVILNRVGSKS